MLKAPSTSYFFEAQVLAVDLKRGACKCRSVDGKLLTNVQWMRELGQSKEFGTNSAPMPGENVYICNVGGAPVIVGSKGIVEVGSSIRASISTGAHSDAFEENYNLSVLSSMSRSGGSIPEDQVPGDQTITNDRGGITGLLRSGSWIAKVSPLAQIFMSRLDDIVRIVSRNYEQFSDAVLRVQVNTKGKIYQYTSYFRSPETSLEGTPDYYEIIGHVEAGEEATDEYLDVDVSGVEGDTVKKQVIPDHYEHTLKTNGNSLRKVYLGAASSLEEMTPGQWKLTVGKSIITVTDGVVDIKTDTLSIDATEEVTINTKDMTTTVTGTHTLNTKDLKVTASGMSTEQIALTRMVQVGGAVTEVSGGPWTITGTPTVIP